MKKEKLVEEGYNKIASKYQSERGSFDSLIELKQFAQLLSPGSKVLDVGCGAGVPVTRFLVDEGFSVTGVDISEGMLALAKKHVPEAKFIKSDMNEISISNNSFDGLVSFYAIIHVPKEKHANLFKEFHKILKPEGTMLISLGRTEWEEVAEYFGAKLFWSHYGREQSLSLVKEAGFEIIFEEVRERGGEKTYFILAKAKK